MERFPVDSEKFGRFRTAVESLDGANFKDSFVLFAAFERTFAWLLVENAATAYDVQHAAKSVLRSLPKVRSQIKLDSVTAGASTPTVYGLFLLVTLGGLLFSGSIDIDPFDSRRML